MGQQEKGGERPRFPATKKLTALVLPKKGQPPLAAPKAAGPAIPSIETVRNLLKEGKSKELTALGDSANSILCKLLTNSKEEWLVRIASAEMVAAMSQRNTRTGDRVLALLMLEQTPALCSLGSTALYPLVNIAKNKDEALNVRIFAAEAIVSISESTHAEPDISTISGLAGILESDSEHPALRAHIAYEITRIGKMCEGAKFRMIEAALEKAAQCASNGTLTNSAQAALELLHIKDYDEDMTIRFPRKPPEK